MSSITFTVPAEYSYVLTTIALSTFVNFYHGHLVTVERKAAGVPYPNAYASAAECKESLAKYRFNCAQRAHSNYLENLPMFVTGAAISGLKYPVASAVMGAVWLIGRIAYLHGYINSSHTSGGKGRYQGIFYYFGQLGLMGTALWTAGGMALETFQRA